MELFRGPRLENNGTRWNLGDILHVLQIAILLGSMGVVYQKFSDNQVQVSIHTQQLNRIEHYLSSKDRAYWNQSKSDE